VTQACDRAVGYLKNRASARAADYRNKPSGIPTYRNKAVRHPNVAQLTEMAGKGKHGFTDRKYPTASQKKSIFSLFFS
jgi:hypothetical protein